MLWPHLFISILSCVVNCQSATLNCPCKSSKTFIVIILQLAPEIAYATPDILIVILWSLDKTRKRHATGLAMYRYMFSKYFCNIVNFFSSKFLTIILRSLLGPKWKKKGKRLVINVTVKLKLEDIIQKLYIMWTESDFSRAMPMIGYRMMVQCFFST